MRLFDRDRVIELLKEKDYIKTSEQEKNLDSVSLAVSSMTAS